MSEESDLNYDDVEVELGEEEVLDTEPEAEADEPEADEVAERGKDEPKHKVSNYVDFERDLNEQKDVIKSRIGEYHRVSMTTQRELDEVRAEKQRLEEELQSLTKQKAPEEPSLDLLIEDRLAYERQLKAYNEHQVQQQLLETRQQEAQQREAAAKKREIEEKSTAIINDAKAKGIDEGMVNAGATFLAETGMMGHLSKEILNNPNASEILALLSVDEEAGAELYYRLRNDPVEAAIFLRTELKAKALNKFAKKPKTPKPATTISGTRGSGKITDDKHGFSVS